MQKFLVKIILFVTLILVLTKQDILAYEVFVNNKYICEKEKAIWREFGNDCADICYKKIEILPICTNSVTMFSCDCGKNKCWDSDNEKCISLKEYIAKIKKAEDDRKKAEEEQKKEEEKRKEEEKKKTEENKAASDVATQIDSTGNPIISATPDTNPTKSDPNADFIAYLSQTCKSFGGQWKNFGNSCAGTCEAKSAITPQSITCSALLSSSCDCGDNKCWYQNKCIKIEDYQKQKAGNNSSSDNNSTNNDAKIPTADGVITNDKPNNIDNTTVSPTDSVPVINDKPINNIPALPEIEQQNKTN